MGKITKICPVCKNEFSVYPYRKNIAIYCSHKCRGKSQLGRNFPHTKEWNQNIAKGNTGGKRSIETKAKLSVSHRGQNKGSKCIFWRGGVDSINRPIRYMIRKCVEYKHWRTDVFYRDNWTCQKCGRKSGVKIEAHHLIRLIDLINKYKIKTLEDAFKCKELWDIKNGKTLCQECHGTKREIHFK